MTRLRTVHGLEAYSGKGGVYSLLKKCAGVESCKGQICSTDRLLSPIAALVDGVVVSAFDRDVRSQTWWGQRQIDCARYADAQYWGTHPIDLLYPDACKLSDLQAASEFADRRAGYPEYWSQDNKVVAILVNRAASVLEKKRARVLARMCGVVCVEVDKRVNLEAWQA